MRHVYRSLTEKVKESHTTRQTIRPARLLDIFSQMDFTVELMNKKRNPTTCHLVLVHNGPDKTVPPNVHVNNWYQEASWIYSDRK